MELRPYKIQESRQRLPDQDLYSLSRVDYDALLDTLKFPVVWSYDRMLESWFPAEVDFAFVAFLKSLPTRFDEKGLAVGRFQQLRRAGLVEPNRRSREAMLSEIQTKGYVRIQQLLDSEYCRYLMVNYYARNDHMHERHPDMEGIKRTSVNNMPLMRLIHQATEKFVNSMIPERVKTSYSFCAAYEPGSNLPAHTDRPQCVYNISMMLGSAPFRASLAGWPLFIKRGDETNAVTLELGDAVLYSGTRDLHWRDVMPKGLGLVLGVFLHYVPFDFTGSLD